MHKSIEVLMNEHRLIEQVMGALETYVDHFRQVVEHAEAFIPLLRGHIQKEDNILYPLAEQAIPTAAFEKLDADCEAFEREVVGSDAIQQLNDLALNLVGAYPPDPERMAAGAACVGCHGYA